MEAAGLGKGWAAPCTGIAILPRSMGPELSWAHQIQEGSKTEPTSLWRRANVLWSKSLADGNGVVGTFESVVCHSIVIMLDDD